MKVLDIKGIIFDYGGTLDGTSVVCNSEGDR